MGLRRISLNLIIYIFLPTFRNCVWNSLTSQTQTWFSCNSPLQRGHVGSQTDDEAQIFLWLLLVKN